MYLTFEMSMLTWCRLAHLQIFENDILKSYFSHSCRLIPITISSRFPLVPHIKLLSGSLIIYAWKMLWQKLNFTILPYTRMKKKYLEREWLDSQTDYSK